jgi:CHAD domain-containing protein
MNGGAIALSRHEPEAPLDRIPNPFLTVDREPRHEFRPLASRRPQPVLDVGVLSETCGLRSDRTATKKSGNPDGAIAGEVNQSVHAIAVAPVAGGSSDLAARAHRPGDAVHEPSPARRKTDVGDRPAKPDRGHWSRPSRLALASDMTAGEAFGLILRDSLSHLAANHDCARLNLHIEGVHQCRVALRRLRSAFKIYQPLLCRERVGSIADAVRWLGEILGTARDLDVLQSELLEPAIAALGRSPPLDLLMASLETRKAAAYAAVGEALTSAPYRHVLVGLCELADEFGRPGANSPGLDQPLVGLASNALSRAHRKLLKRGSGFEILSKTERHDVRIALKRLRYTLDFFGSLFDGRSKKRFTRRVARLQDALGRMNDIEVADTMLAQLVGIARDGCEAAALAAPPGALVFAAGGVLGWYRRGGADIDRRLVKDWYEFVRARPFWLCEQPAVA